MKTQKQLNQNIVGPTKAYSTPITLDPAYYEGSIVYGDDGVMRYSDGTRWVLFQSFELEEDVWYAAVDLGTMD